MTSVLHLKQYAITKRAERRNKAKRPKSVKENECEGFVVGASNGLTAVSIMILLARVW